MITALAGGAFTKGQITSPLTVAAAPTALNSLACFERFRHECGGKNAAVRDGLPANDRSRVPLWFAQTRTPRKKPSTLSQI